MRIGDSRNVILALPLRAKATEPLAGGDVSQQGSGTVLWASPAMAKVLGGSCLGALPVAAKPYLKKLPNSGALRQVAEVLEIADGPLSDALTRCAEDRQISGIEGKLFKAVIKGVEILCECANPSEDKSKVERMLSLSLNTLVVLEPVTDFVPALHGAGPLLMGLIEFGDKLMMAVQVNRQRR